MYKLKTKKTNRLFGEMTVCECETLQQVEKAYKVTRCLGVREIVKIN